MQKSKVLAEVKFFAKFLIFDCSAPGNHKSDNLFLFFFFFFFLKRVDIVGPKIYSFEPILYLGILKLGKSQIFSRV